MRLIEGTVEEVVEYQRQLGSRAAASPAEVAPVPDVIPNGEDPVAARTASGGDWTIDDEFFLKRFVYGRATDAAVAEYVLKFIYRAADLGTIVESGASERSKDGLTDYLMVRDDGPRRFGAVAYVKPSNGGLTLRLRPEDVADISNERIKPRDVAASQKYAINCPLVDEAAVDLAIELTQRALELVRTKE